MTRVIFSVDNCLTGMDHMAMLFYVKQLLMEMYFGTKQLLNHMNAQLFLMETQLLMVVIL